MSKAFDGVWLFDRLRELGIHGRTWRLLYKTYIDFKCRARVQHKVSEWYTLECGIHQGGFLSNLKYLAFINTVLVELENSNLCCSIYRTNTSPLGCADDIAATSMSKHSSDQVLNIVYGESINEQKQNSKYRMFSVGGEQVKPWSDKASVPRAVCLRIACGRKSGRSQDNLAGASRSWPQP